MFKLEYFEMPHHLGFAVTKGVTGVTILKVQIGTITTPIMGIVQSVNVYALRTKIAGLLSVEAVTAHGGQMECVTNLAQIKTTIHVGTEFQVNS